MLSTVKWENPGLLQSGINENWKCDSDPGFPDVQHAQSTNRKDSHNRIQQTLYWSPFMVDRIDEEQRTQNPGTNVQAQHRQMAAAAAPYIMWTSCGSGSLHHPDIMRIMRTSRAAARRQHVAVAHSSALQYSKNYKM
ncbi:hypothetical protein STEG23_018065 [Scotinomys teguina]